LYQLHQGQQRFSYLDRNRVLYLFCEARTRTPRQSCAHTFHQPSRGVDQLRPHRHQCVPGSQHHQILAHFSTAMPNRVQRLRIHSPQSCQLVGIDAIALPLTTLRPFHQPRVGHQHLVSPLGDHVLHPSRVSSYFDHYPRHGQCLEEFPYIFLRCPQLSFGQRLSLQTKNAVLTPAVPQIHSHRQTISIGANRVSLAIFFCARRHRRRIQFSRQLSQDFRQYFFRISLHRATRFRPLFTLPGGLAMLLQGRSPFSCDCTLSALITASLTPSVIGDRPSHPIWFRHSHATRKREPNLVIDPDSRAQIFSKVRLSCRPPPWNKRRL